MPQKSPVYAVTRIRVHEKDMVKPERMARMAEASPAEVMRALGDMGYGGISDPQLSDGDRMIAKELSDAYALINEVTFSPEQTDLFILKGDANNLKLLIKQRLTGTADSPALMKGVYPKDDIIRMVHNADYRELPEEFTKRLNALEQSFSGEIDPGRISTEIDRAYLEHCLNNAKGVSLEYFKSLADFTNILTMLRLRNMGAGADKLKASLRHIGEVHQGPVAEAQGDVQVAQADVHVDAQYPLPGHSQGGGHRPRTREHTQGPGGIRQERQAHRAGAPAGQLPHIPF